MKLTFLVVVFLCGYHILSHAQTGIVFLSEKDFVSVSASEKPIYLDFYTDWCVPCKVMDKEVFQDKLVGDYFNEHFVSYKIDAESEIGRQIAERYEVVAYPTSIFLDEELKILSRKQGSMTAANFMKTGEVVLENLRPVSVAGMNTDSLFKEIKRLDNLGLESTHLANLFFRHQGRADFEKQQHIDLLFSKVTLLDYDNPGYSYFLKNIEKFKQDTARIENLLFKANATHRLPPAYNYDNKLHALLSLPMNAALAKATREKDPIMFEKMISERQGLFESIYHHDDVPFMMKRGTYRQMLEFYLSLSTTDSIAEIAEEFQHFLLDKETPESVLRENQRLYQSAKERLSVLMNKDDFSAEEEQLLNSYLNIYLEDLDLLLLCFDKFNALPERKDEVRDFKNKLINSSPSTYE